MKIFVAGHRGMVGRAILRALDQKGDGHEVVTRTRAELDLTRQTDVQDFMRAEKFDAVVLAAAKVGGIHANNTYPADFLGQNLVIQSNVIDAAHQTDVPQLMFLGSSCIYPKLADQPIKETALLTGPLEPTNEPYAIAKIAGIKLCESLQRQHGRDYRSVMPSNLYGPFDNFDPVNSHVVPALIRRFHEVVAAGQDEVVIWGSGTPLREFCHVDDMADACLFLLGLPQDTYQAALPKGTSHVNIGTGEEVSIRDLARMIAKAAGFEGRITQDATKPDGTPRKVMDNSVLKSLGWSPSIVLAEGIPQAYDWYVANASK